MAVERCLSLLLFFSISLTFPLVEGVYSTKGNCLVPLQVPILDVGGKWMLRIEHLSKVYGEKKAVDDLSLHIRPGEIYGFIGHNGAGKTTTIKAVQSKAGVYSGQSGSL